MSLYIMKQEVMSQKFPSPFQIIPGIISLIIQDIGITQTEGKN